MRCKSTSLTVRHSPNSRKSTTSKPPFDCGDLYAAAFHQVQRHGVFRHCLRAEFSGYYLGSCGNPMLFYRFKAIRRGQKDRLGESSQAVRAYVPVLSLPQPIQQTGPIDIFRGSGLTTNLAMFTFGIASSTSPATKCKLNSMPRSCKSSPISSFLKFRSKKQECTRNSVCLFSSSNSEDVRLDDSIPDRSCPYHTSQILEQQTRSI